jgi:Transglutaminase-like superfamily
MSRFVRAGIVILWVTLLGVLLRERWTSPPEKPRPATHATLHVGDEWLNVYHQTQKIGYVHQHVAKTDGGFDFEEQSLLRLVVMDAPQTVRTILSGQTGPNYALQEFNFELSSGVGTLRAHGLVGDGALSLTLSSSGDRSTQRIPLTGPIYLPSVLRDVVAADELRAGHQLQLEVFDPAAMQQAIMQVTVERQEPVPDDSSGQRAWRVREEFKGIRTTAWIDDQGNTLREEGPMGLVLQRTDAREAIHDGWDDGSALDLVQTVAIPVTQAIDKPRQASSLRVHLRGIDLDQVPSDARQKRDGDTWTIQREDLRTATSYALPYTKPSHRTDLQATTLLQVDHPRVRAAAAQAIGGERDALGAVRRLLAWIHGYMRQAITVSIPNALQVLDERQGDCNEHSVLFAALARASGIPTRVVAGVVYLNGAFYYHAWDEVWLGRWISVDPVFDQFPADATHIKFVEGGPEEQFEILRVIGRVGIDVLASESAVPTSGPIATDKPPPHDHS